MFTTSWKRAILGLSSVVVITASLSGVAVSNARTASPASGDHTYSYSGDDGPGFWGQLSTAWHDCSDSRRQSPINIAGAIVGNELKPPVISIRPTPVHLDNNWHTVVLRYPQGSFIRWNGQRYDLLQAHFHTPSEHTVNGHRYAMELHAVFRDPATDRLVVIGQFYRVGSANRFLDRFDRFLPEKSGQSTTLRRRVNLANAFTDTTSYWTYPGSLTTPPCSPTVTFILLKRVATMSERQLRQDFWRIMGNNFRPPQNRNGRLIQATP